MIAKEGHLMAETWEDYGDLAEEEIYQSKSTLGKIFSTRTLGKVMKYFLAAIALTIYGILAFRLCTQKPPKAVSKMLWTEDTLAAYTANDDMTVFGHEAAEAIAKDGYFGVYDILYIPESQEFQVTVRFNNSSTDKLYNDLYEKAKEQRRNELVATLTEEQKKNKELIEEKLTASIASDPIEVDIAEIPFVFLLRDNTGEVYTSYDYILTSHTVYQYMRISFKKVNLFGDARTAPNAFYPTPDVPMAEYIYKGADASVGNEIKYLFLDMYDANHVDVNGKTFAYPLQVYSYLQELTVYDYSKDISTSVTENLTAVDLQ